MSKSSKLPQIGHNQAVAKKLYKFLADSYTTLLATQNLHWNVEGKDFYSVHKLTEQLYNEQFLANDEIAERLRTIGQKVDGTAAGFAAATSIKPKATPTLDGLIAIQEEAANSAQELLDTAEKAEDAATADLATTRLEVHQKNVWLLKSQRG